MAVGLKEGISGHSDGGESTGETTETGFNEQSESTQDERFKDGNDEKQNISGGMKPRPANVEVVAMEMENSPCQPALSPNSVAVEIRSPPDPAQVAQVAQVDVPKTAAKQSTETVIPPKGRPSPPLSARSSSSKSTERKGPGSISKLGHRAHASAAELEKGRGRKRAEVGALARRKGTPATAKASLAGSQKNEDANTIRTPESTSKADVKRKTSTPASGRRASSLYERGMAKKAEKEKKAVELALSQTPTFTPTLIRSKSRHRCRLDNSDTLSELTPTPTRSKSRHKGRLSSGDAGVSDRLYNPQHLQQRDEQLRYARQRLEMEECTFSPGLVSSPTNTGSRTNRFELLYQQGQKRKEEKVEKECTFSPNISKSQRNRRGIPGKNEHTPVFDRLSQRAQVLAAKKAIRQMGNTDEKDLTFKPKINKPKEGGTLRGSERLEHLYNDGLRKAQSRRKIDKEEEEARRRRQEEKELVECTFRPRTNWRKECTVETQFAEEAQKVPELVVSPHECDVSLLDDEEALNDSVTAGKERAEAEAETESVPLDVASPDMVKSTTPPTSNVSTTPLNVSADSIRAVKGGGEVINLNLMKLVNEEASNSLFVDEETTNRSATPSTFDFEGRRLLPQAPLRDSSVLGYAGADLSSDCEYGSI